MSYVAEILAIGTELLLGGTANTDAQMVSQELSSLGIHVYYHTVVGDNPERIRAAVEIARSRADILITTGGLGPTSDDLTKQVVAAAFGKPLVYHEEVAEQLRQFYQNRLRGQVMPETNLQQAMFPAGCVVLQNELGTAPGCIFEAQGKHVLMLPGPLIECVRVLHAGGLAYLQALSDAVIVSRTIRMFGIGESAMEVPIRTLITTMENPTLAPYAKEGEVYLRVTAKAKTQAEAIQILEPVVEQMKARYGDLIYGVDVASMEARVLQCLQDNGLTLSTAESCTGGLIAKRMTDLPGASQAFFGGVVAYTDAAKQELLGISKGLLQEYGAISGEVALAMADGIRHKLRTDLAVAATGVVGPDSDERGNPVGLVFIALTATDGRWVRRLHLNFDRKRARVMAANHGLDMLRRYLTGAPVNRRKLHEI